MRGRVLIKGGGYDFDDRKGKGRVAGMGVGDRLAGV